MSPSHDEIPPPFSLILVAFNHYVSLLMLQRCSMAIFRVSYVFLHFSILHSEQQKLFCAFPVNCGASIWTHHPLATPDTNIYCSKVVRNAFMSSSLVNFMSYGFCTTGPDHPIYSRLLHNLLQGLHLFLH